MGRSASLGLLVLLCLAGCGLGSQTPAACSKQMCTGRGTCTPDQKRCKCFASRVEGFFEGLKCEGCVPNYYPLAQVTPPGSTVAVCTRFCIPRLNCTEGALCNPATGFCSCPESFCNGHGTCTGASRIEPGASLGMRCKCHSDSTLGHWDPITNCSTCIRGYKGDTCTQSTAAPPTPFQPIASEDDGVDWLLVAVPVGVVLVCLSLLLSLALALWARVYSRPLKRRTLEINTHNSAPALHSPVYEQINPRMVPVPVTPPPLMMTPDRSTPVLPMREYTSPGFGSPVPTQPHFL